MPKLSDQSNIKCTAQFEERHLANGSKWSAAMILSSHPTTYNEEAQENKTERRARCPQKPEGHRRTGQTGSSATPLQLRRYALVETSSKAGQRRNEERHKHAGIKTIGVGLGLQRNCSENELTRITHFSRVCALTRQPEPSSWIRETAEKSTINQQCIYMALSSSCS